MASQSDRVLIGLRHNGVETWGLLSLSAVGTNVQTCERLYTANRLNIAERYRKALLEGANSIDLSRPRALPATVRRGRRAKGLLQAIDLFLLRRDSDAHLA